MAREPLVKPYVSNSPASRLRKNLPTEKWGSGDMDTTDPRKTSCLDIKPDLRFYLDTGDSEREKD